MAVAGFSESEIEIVQQENGLTVTGKQAKEEAPKSFLYRGIAARPFERRFELAEYIRVGGATLENGLLHVELVREVPEAVKPRNVKINGAAKAEPQVVENKAAA